MTCRGAVVEVVSTFKIVTSINSLKMCYLQYDVPCRFIGLLVRARTCCLNKNTLEDGYTTVQMCLQRSYN